MRGLNVAGTSTAAGAAAAIGSMAGGGGCGFPRVLRSAIGSAPTRTISATASAVPMTPSDRARSLMQPVSAAHGHCLDARRCCGCYPPSALAARPPHLLELGQRLRPVALQQRRQPAVGEQLAAALAHRAVVALVVRVADALHGRTADRARLAVAAVHGHALAERGDLVGETVADFLAQPRGPRAQRVAAPQQQALQL